MHIFLIGYMGAGKSTLGKQLAQKLQLDFYDLDKYIETQRKCSISDFFKKYGETVFRKEEKKALLELIAKENCVISVGGGTPCFEDNMELMNASGKTIFLNSPIDSIIKRLQSRVGNRPLLANKSKEEIANFITENYNERLPYYLKAQHKIQAANIRVEDLLPFFN